MNRVFKKLLILCAMIFIATPSLVRVNASSDFITKPLVDVATSQGMYKFSQGSNDIYLPFIIVSNNRVYIDKEVTKPGMIFAKDAIDVTSKMNEPQLMISTDTVRINADTNYSAICASNVIISTSINKSMLIFAQNITFEEGATITDDVICYANEINMSGNIKGSFIARAEKININGNIEKDLRVQTKKIEVSKDISINGQIYIETDDTTLNIKDKYPQAEVVYIDYSGSYQRSTNIYEEVVSGITTCLIFVLIYLLIQKLSKAKAFKNMMDKCKISPMYTIFTGLLSIILMPIVLILLIIVSLFGFGIITGPLFMVLLVVFMVTMILSTFIVGSVIFEYIKSKNSAMFNNQLNILVGLFVTYAAIYTLCRLPNIGWYATLAVAFISLGIIFTSLTKKMKGTTEIIDNKENK